MQKLGAVFAETNVFFGKIRLAGQRVDVGLATREQVPVGGVDVVGGGKRFQPGHAVNPGRNAVRQQHYAGVGTEGILHQFQVLRHNGADASATRENEIGYVDFTSNSPVGDALPVLVGQGKRSNGVAYFLVCFRRIGQKNRRKIGRVVVRQPLMDRRRIRTGNYQPQQPEQTTG